MNLTYKEISAWISAGVLAVLYFYYFLAAPAAATPGAAFELFIGVAIAIVFVEIVTHVAAALLHRPEKTDERDRLIGIKAYRNAYFVLAAGIVAVIFYLLTPAPLSTTLAFAAVPPAIMAVHFLVLSCAVAEGVKYASLIVYYRLGA